MQIERHEIRVLSAVIEEGGFSRAAERLNVSQSAVSQAIANLEHKLNTALLVRGRVPSLTEAGLRLFRFAQTMINEERNALDDIAQIRSGALSTLNLAMNSLVNRFYATALLLKFCERNPLTRLKLDVVPSREIVYGVDEDRWELGFGPFQHEMPGHFVVRGCFEEQRLLVAHRSHPRFETLIKEPLEVLGEVTLITSYLDEATKRPGHERLRDLFASVWEVSHLELRLALLRAGKGVTFLSDRLLADQDGFVAIPDLEFGTIRRTVGVYYKKHKPLSEAAKRFLAIVEGEFV
jgi:LysR family transcriptional regulator, hydrogen peroxide-inducible genes activator